MNDLAQMYNTFQARAQWSLQLFCQSPYTAICDQRAAGSFALQAVDQGPIDDNFFQEIKRAVGKALFSDTSLSRDFAWKLWNRIPNVHLIINDDHGSARPNAHPIRERRLVSIDKGMIAKATRLAAAQGKGPRSFLFHILAHELSHYFDSDGPNGLRTCIARQTRHVEEGIADHWANRAMAYWKQWPDPLTLANAQRDGLAVLCTMSQSPNHPLKSQRANMLRSSMVGKWVCGYTPGTCNSAGEIVKGL